LGKRLLSGSRTGATRRRSSPRPAAGRRPRSAPPSLRRGLSPTVAVGRRGRRRVPRLGRWARRRSRGTCRGRRTAFGQPRSRAAPQSRGPRAGCGLPAAVLHAAVEANRDGGACENTAAEPAAGSAAERGGGEGRRSTAEYGGVCRARGRLRSFLWGGVSNANNGCLSRVRGAVLWRKNIAFIGEKYCSCGWRLWVIPGGKG
jgi:hypothetical protein